MTLDETVIVTEDQIERLYHRKDHREKGLSVLQDMNFLPLTVKSLTTEKGKALLFLATWVYFSGDLCKRQYTPKIAGNTSFLNHLNDYLFMPLTKKFEVKNGAIRLLEDGGAIGRLIHAMGVPIPEKTEKDKVSRKSSYNITLPHYFQDIINSSPKKDSSRKDLLYDITKVLFKDRFFLQDRHSNVRTRVPQLILNNHSTKQSATKCGEEIVDFLNYTILDRNRQGIFSYDQIDIQYNKGKKLYGCKLYLTNEQLGHMVIKHNPSLFNISVNHP